MAVSRMKESVFPDFRLEGEIFLQAGLLILKFDKEALRMDERPKIMPYGFLI